MPLEPKIHERWLANLAAAGIQAPDEDIQRIIDRGHADRVEEFMRLLAKLDQPGELPDYLRDTVGEAAGDE